jgi:signal transduction histidine kinase/ActR/RegA family two-component response regulator
LNLRLLIFAVLTSVSTIPVGILGYWQYRLIIDNKTAASGDQQLISQLTTISENFSEAAVMIAIMAIIIALVAGWWLAGIIVKPLREFEKTANSITGGKFSSEFPTSMKFQPDEIRDLSNSLNQMAGEMVKNNTELQKAMELAEESNHSRSNFLSSMGHELRTPLNSIIGFSQVLSLNKNVPLTTEQESHVNNILNSGHHLLKLISQVLDLSTIDAGKLNITLDAVNPAVVIEECLTAIESVAASQSITIANNTVIKNLPIILADAIRLKQVILNLLSNAVKYSQAGGTVTINTAVTTNRMLRINISDTGPGISKQEYDKIFVPFESISQKSEKPEGSGIGLTISKQIVESMNGSIGLESEIGKGSTFWVSLPITDTSEQHELTDSRPNIPKQRAYSTDLTARTKRVLYIEDNPINTQLMELIFASIPNAELTTAMTGEEGLKLANQISPDLILMDIFLPGMDGLEASRILKDSTSTTDIPIIAISAATWDVDVDRARDLGFFAYLTKPIDIPQTLSTIQKALEQ